MGSTYLVHRGQTNSWICLAHLLPECKRYSPPDQTDQQLATRKASLNPASVWSGQAWICQVLQPFAFPVTQPECPEDSKINRLSHRTSTQLGRSHSELLHLCPGPARLSDPKTNGRTIPDAELAGTPRKINVWACPWTRPLRTSRRGRGSQYPVSVPKING